MSSLATIPEDYDLVVLGSGEAGKYLAWTLAKTGMKVIVVERKYIGGSCPNIACLPSKNIIHHAKVASFFQRSEEFGITKDNWKINLSGVRERKRQMVAELVDLHLDLFKQSGSQLVMGSGRFVGAKILEVSSSQSGTRLLRGRHLVIDTGSRATVDRTPGLSEASPLTHIEALELDQIPEHLLVIGGGYIGLELSQAMRRFGSRVTIIDRNPRLVHREDSDVTAALEELVRSEGIEVSMNTQITRVDGESGQAVKLSANRDGSDITFAGTHLLVAAGRTPNTEGLGLELAGVQTTEHGHVKVNERLETSASDVWAVGDCAGSPQFTHISFDDFRIVRDNIMGGNE